MIATGNGANDKDTKRPNFAQRSRCCHIYVHDNEEAGLEGYLDWSVTDGRSDALRAFAKHRTDVWMGKDPVFRDEGTDTKRSWDNADRLALACDQVSFKTDDILLALINGCVGQVDGIKYFTWWKAYKKLPDIDQVLTDPMGATVPKESDVQLILAETLISKMDDTVNENIVKYSMRLPDEITATIIDDMERKEDTVASMKEVCDWKNKRYG